MDNFLRLKLSNQKVIDQNYVKLWFLCKKSLLDKYDDQEDQFIFEILFEEMYDTEKLVIHCDQKEIEENAFSKMEKLELISLNYLKTNTIVNIFNGNFNLKILQIKYSKFKK